MPIARIPVAWATGIGGAGVSVFYSPFGTDPTVELATFFNAIKTLFPNAVSWDIPGTGDVITQENGLITGAWTGGTAATVTATGGVGAYAAGTGAFARWQTNGIVGGRRVRGRTFLCPLITGAYDNNGTLATTNLTTLVNAAVLLAASNKLVIWHRPSPGGTDGSSHAVVGATVPDKVTSLRTRRT